MIFKIKLNNDLSVCPRRKLMMQCIRVLNIAGYSICEYKDEIAVEYSNNGHNLDEARITILQKKINELNL